MDFINYLDDQILNSGEFKKAFSDWNVRVAVRGVLNNVDGKIGLMYIKKYKMYKLPGGGVDEEEDLEAGFHREMLEETGFDTKAVGDIGIFIEKRDEWKLFQLSFCYLAEVVEKGEVQLTGQEQEEGFELVWVDTLDEAIKLVSESKTEHYDGHYMRMRDAEVLKKAKNIFAR